MTTTQPQLNRRQRLSWTVVMGSFIAFCLIALSVPLLGSAHVQNAVQFLNVQVQTNQGTVRIDGANGDRFALLVGEPSQNVEPGAQVLTDGTATAVVVITAPDDVRTLARLQVYSNTTFNVENAETPRFQWSDNERVLNLFLESGRLRLSVPEMVGSGVERPLRIMLTTPQGSALVTQSGQYLLSVNNQETQVTVQQGRLLLGGDSGTLLLTSDQRGYVPTGQTPVGPLDTERNLVRNGTFSEGFADWEEFAWTVELDDQPGGETAVVPVAGENVLQFARGGSGHADTSVRQRINVDVTDYQSIRLLLTFRILDQSLGVCGVNGSECPLFIRVDYVDDVGGRRSWRQGFYGSGEVVTGQTPDACTTCAGAIAQRTHDRVPLNQLVFYEVDLRNELARLGAWPPRFIESVSLEASGHSFVVEVVDISLVVDLNGERPAQ